MADKKLNEVTTVNSGTLANVKNFLAVMNDGSIQQMSKSDLASVVGGLLPVVSINNKGLMPTSGFIDRGTITTEDFDELKSNGIYQLSGASGNHAPTTFGVMIVINKADMILQLVANVLYPFKLKYRIRGFSEPYWKEWREI